MFKKKIVSNSAWIRIVIICAWLATISWLIRFEAFPGFFSDTLKGYRAIIPSDVLMTDSWMQLKLDEQPVGYSHYNIQTEEKNHTTFYVITNSLFVRLRVMGDIEQLEADSSARVDLGYRLQEFNSIIKSTVFSAKVHGQRAEGDQFDISFALNNNQGSIKLDLPDDTIIFSPIVGLGSLNLKPGRTLNMRVFNPVSMSPEIVTLKSERSEIVHIDGKEHKAIVITSVYRNIKITSWVDSKTGELLRQTSPFGFTMEKSKPEEAFAMTTNTASRVDFLEIMEKKLQEGLSEND